MTYPTVLPTPAKRRYAIYPTMLDSFDWWRTRPSAKAEQELMDKLNKRPFKATPAMERGTAFNELVDELVKRSVIVDPTSHDKVLQWKGQEFPRDVTEDISARVKGCMTQKYLQAYLDFDGMTVKVYGFADYVDLNKIWELKTGSYYPGKFARRWQRATYLACHPSAKSFTYLVTDFINVYEETYDDPGLPALRQTIEEFVDFVEKRRSEIVNPKLFGG